jgi:hypothetical protein
MITTTMLKRVNRTVLTPRSASAACICIHTAVDESELEIISRALQFVSFPAGGPISHPKPLEQLFLPDVNLDMRFAGSPPFGSRCRLFHVSGCNYSALSILDIDVGLLSTTESKMGELCGVF